jgi:diguanylate cyclase (GGDEF)-like protein/PAS domain S-box-containing protein
MESTRILVVEDENIVALDLKNRLQNLGYEVPATAATGADAIRLAQETQPNLILMDIVLKGEMDGIQAASEILAHYGIPVIFLSAYGDESFVQRARDLQPLGYILKPFKERELHATIQAGLHRRQIELKLKESEERNRRIIETAQEGIWILDTDDRTVFVNARMAEMLGYSIQEMLGVDQRVFIDPSASNSLVSTSESAPDHQIGQQIIKFCRKNPSQFLWALVSTNPITDGAGKFTGTLTMVMDITERKAAEDKLMHARDELEQRVQERTAELAQANQELQTLLIEHAHAKKELEATSKKLTIWVAELEQRNRESMLLNEMGDLLSSCRDAKEAYDVVTRFAQKLFPNVSGGISVISASRNYVEQISSWGSSPPQEQVFVPGDCWALRRGRVHSVNSNSIDPRCQHVTPDSRIHHICVPMAAQGEALGVLHLQSDYIAADPASREPAVSPGSRISLAVAMGEHIALALANLALRESLRNQAIHDPLTGLFNRHYMEEILERELHRSIRQKSSVGTIMIDVDHFKIFNDTHGHVTGDRILRAIGHFLRTHSRTEDIACRYGGEEFIVILPETTLDVTIRRAEELRIGISELHNQGMGTNLPGVTASLGVASFPMHSLNIVDLIQSADAALYRAKREGRNRVAVASSTNAKDANLAK